MNQIIHYITPEDKDLFIEWLESLKDTKAKVATVRRLGRIQQGNFGDHKFCRNGVWELRIDVGAGYRVYYALAGKTVVLLLCGGNKGSQDKDINNACNYWLDWQGRQ